MITIFTILKTEHILNCLIGHGRFIKYLTLAVCFGMSVSYDIALICMINRIFSGNGL
jgi:hypothetical protein